MSDTPTKDIIKEAKERLQIKTTVSDIDCAPSPINVNDLAPKPSLAMPKERTIEETFHEHFAAKEHGESVKDFRKPPSEEDFHPDTPNAIVSEDSKTHTSSAQEIIAMIRNGGRE